MQPDNPDDAPPNGEGDDEARAFSPPATRKSASETSSSSSDAPGQQPPQVAPPTHSVTPATGDDCGTCTACLDKPKFGGPGVKRKGCMSKRATMEPRAPVGSLLDSVLRPPALTTPPVPGGTSDSASSEAPVRRVRASSLSQMARASDLASGEPAAAAASEPSSEPAASGSADGGVTAAPPDEDSESPPRRKDYALRKRGAAAGEQILEQAESGSGADSADGASQDDASMMVCQDVDPEEGDAPPLPTGEAATGALEGSSGAEARKSGRNFMVVRLKGTGLEGSPEGGSSSAAAAEHAGSSSGGVPSTPMLKTPELEEVAAGGALGMSPLSEFANLLDMTPRLPDQGGYPGTSPLFQLASLMEQTPRLQVPNGKKDAPAEPEELGKALLASVESPGGESPAPSSTGQLRRDLSRALLQATSLASPSAGVGTSGQMLPPPPPGGADNANARNRKRKLEGDLGLESSKNAFEQLGGHVVLDDERLMIRDLLDGESLELNLAPAAKPKHRSKAKEKEKGKPARCRCDRSGCLKRYCVCFAAGNMCSPDCKCKGCANDDSTEERKAARDQAIVEMQKKKANAFNPRIDGEGDQKVHMTGCNCKKSGCRKRYCECYQAGVKCTEKCKCSECHNPAGTNPNAGLAPIAVRSSSGGDDGALGSELLVLTEELPSPSAAELAARRTPTMSPVGASAGGAGAGLGTFPSLGKPSQLRNSPFAGRSPFAALTATSPAGSPTLDGLAAAAAAAAADGGKFKGAREGSALLPVDPTSRKLEVDALGAADDADLPGSPDPEMRTSASVEMMPSPDAGLILPQAKLQPAADTPDPCAGGASSDAPFMRDPACSTPSPPALASEARDAQGVQHAPTATAAVLPGVCA